MGGNALASLREGIFDQNTALTLLSLNDNALESLREGIFDNLTAITALGLNNNALITLPAGIFNNLTAMTWLGLHGNQISNVSTVENLTSLTNLFLVGNPISDYGPLRRLIARNPNVTIDIDIPAENPAENPAPAPAIQVRPAKTALLSNYPNPFNPETWIPYQLSEPADVTMTIYDISGIVVRELALGHQAAGYYNSRTRAAHWDGRNALGEKVATGVYFYTFTAGDFTATQKMLIRK